MTKTDIAKNVANTVKIDMDDALAAVNATIGALRAGIMNGEDIFIRGFGTFKAVTRKEKRGRDILKNTSVVIPARKTVKLILCSELKKNLNKANKS